MQETDVYVLTTLGEQELRGSVTARSAEEIELMVRIDGVLSVSQIRASMPDFPAAAITPTFSKLINQGMLRLAEADPFGDQFQMQLNRAALSSVEAEADVGAKSLGKSGYYVSIARTRGAARQLGDGERYEALVVDDEPALAKFIQSYLAFEGFHVRLATNRAEVVAELRRPPRPDLVLLDVMLPDADGFDILQRMRQHPVLKHVPVIMLTGKTTREAVIKGLASGADGYITKPFEADALMHAVRTVLGVGEEASPAPPDGVDWRNHTRY